MSSARRSLLTFLGDNWEYWIYQAFRRLPVDLAPVPAKWLTLREIDRNRPWVRERARENLRRLLPDDSDSDREQRLENFVQSLALFVGETSAVVRFTGLGRVEIIGGEALVALAGSGPVLLLCLHTGNWEVSGEAAQTLKIPVSTFYQEAETTAQTRVLKDIRRRVGFELLESNHQGMRDALRRLAKGEAVAIFGDEARHGCVMAPLFGRPARLDCNLALAAKLARRTQAPIMVTYVTRLAPGRFQVTIQPPLHLTDPARTLLDDVLKLNAVIEPIILRHLDQWFFLDDRLE
jgi:KDO2-lipid IV(A) lauroyltransferase